MAKQSIFNNLKRRICILLSTILLVCTAGLVLVACNDETTTEYTDKTYSHEWNDDADIKNGGFEFGSDELEDKQFPQSSSINNWSLSVDNAAQSSLVSSGIIKTNDTAWEQLISNMYDDTDFRTYAEKKWNISSSDKETVISSIKTNFLNPKTPVGSTGEKVFMMNNYPSTNSLGAIGLGTAQKLTSATTITLEPGSYGKITVFVKTVNLAHNGVGDYYGANIRLTNTVGSTTQAEYRISGIDTQASTGLTLDANGWAKYEIFVKADDFINNSVVVVLGLGYGDGNSTASKYYCEGTAYFDDVLFEEIEANLFDETKSKIVKYSTSAKTPLETSALNNQKFYYSMDVEDSLNAYASTYFADYSGTPTNEFTTSSTTINGKRFGDDSTASYEYINNEGEYACAHTTAKIHKVNMKNASYTINFGSKTAPFSTLAPETYEQVVFYLKKDLGKFDINGISILLYDVYSNTAPGYTPIEKLSDTIKPTFTEEGEWIKVSFNVTNNFPEKNVEGKFINDVRSYFFKVIVGPTDVVATTKIADYATGTVLMSNPRVAKGFTYNYNRSEYVADDNSTGYNSYQEVIAAGKTVKEYTIAEAKEENRTPNNDYYSLFLGLSDKKIALYNGLGADYSDDTQKDAYLLTTSPSNVGSILTAPADPDGFTGVNYDHSYINGESKNFMVNDRSGNGTAAGNAGLVNTKYLASYANGAAIATALNHTSSSPAQPLMIYNATADSYGYIGEELSIAANTYTNVTVQLRVVGDAKAFVYLVDTSKAKKSVMTIDVPVNTDGEKYLDDDKITTYSKQMAFEVNSSMMREEENGWVTLNFYIGAGNVAKSVRLELWNGSRDGQTKSTGYVFFDEISNAAFTEPTGTYSEQFSSDGVLKSALIYEKDTSSKANALLHKRALTETEIEYNKDESRKNDAVAYDAKYIWYNSATTIYAIYNTLEVDAVDPYASEPADEETSSCASCSEETDPSTFWLSFSTILLGVALAFALIALIAKSVITKRKANKNDAKSHYTVSSRYTKSKSKKKTADQENSESENENEEETTAEEASEEQTETTENIDDVIDVDAVNDNVSTIDEEDLIYGDVQDFGIAEETTAEQASEEPANDEGADANDSSDEDNK